MHRKIVAIAAAFVSLAAGTSFAQTPLRVLASNGMRAVIEELESELERGVGRPVDIDFSTTAAQRQRIEAGASFDAVVLTADALDALARAGKVAADSVAPLGRSGVGVGVRAGAAKPDVGTPDALKATLLAAKSVTFVGVGASRPHIERMLETLGIAAQMQPKIVLTQGVDESLDAVGSGKADVVLTLASEILPAHDVQYVGPLPAALQNYVSFAAGASPTSSARADVDKLVAALRAPTARAVYEAKGMEQAAR